MITGGNHSSTGFPMLTLWTVVKMNHSEFTDEDDQDFLGR